LRKWRETERPVRARLLLPFARERRFRGWFGKPSLELFNFEKVEQLCADFPKNQRCETVARRTCFAAKQLFQSENALRERNTMEQVSLRTLDTGQTAVIAGITAEGEMGRRIRDMGLVPGVSVQVMGRAPLQDPVALRLLGFTLTLRNREADFIKVTQ
jgi:ferrous iron transport protein A